MPWNEPGNNNNNNNNKDPWGNKRDQNPPDLDKILGNLLRKLRALFIPKKENGSSDKNSWKPSNSKEAGYIAGAVAGGLLVLWFLSGFFIVDPAEEAVILRLGKYSETLQSGLHWFARFIETKYTIDVQKIYSFSLQGDFLTKSSDQNDLQTIPVDNTKKTGVADQSKNLVNVELNVQYRIRDPQAYLFNIVNPDDTIQQVASGALSDIIGTMKLDEALTTGREFLSSAVLERSKQVLKNYNSGLEVLAVTLRKVQAPDQVQAAFNDVNRADQDRSTYIQQAQAYASKVVPIAQGVAARTLADANAYQQQVVLGAQANVARYQALLKVYASSPDVTRERMYLDTMQTILQNTTKVLVDVNAGNNLLYLPLDKLLKQPIAENKNLPNGSSSIGEMKP
ncbi:MAG TPA: FtsH protease activity modulator HflK [Gammaproteobacteria bacterium]|nr:FtsH protease activity modulator HflK [Gammaproteobacteria bacterium]